MHRKVLEMVSVCSQSIADLMTKEATQLVTKENTWRQFNCGKLRSNILEDEYPCE
jgi:hypothetical protein